jgi:hypothetical protein
VSDEPESRPAGHARRRRRPEPARARRRRLVRVAGSLLGGAIVFAVRIALGDAYGDRPRTPRPVVRISSVRPVVVTQTVATRTVTVVVSTP